MRTFRGLGIVSAVLAGLLARPATAVDLAAEADFLFRRGTEAYQRRDYGSALERFHASNRLVPNRNVLFNIAYTYEKLQRYPEAYHYFLQVLEVEKDPAQLEKVRQAMAALERLVGVLEVETTPPGATLYVDRKDLGSRGTSPRVLGLEPGALTLLVELAGHHPERILVQALAAGQRRTLQVRLRPILGYVRLESPRGARLTALNQSSTSCEAPCELALRPGIAELRVDLGGYRPFVTSVSVAADALQRLNPILRPETGRLVVKTDEPGAEVSSGGVTLGFTPTVVALPAGEHWVTLSRAGFRKERRRVLIAADSGTELRVSMKQEEEVTAASRVRERVERAPSSVSIVSRAELEAFRYPTIAEALRGVPGAYVWDDGSYVSVGFRGISRLGDYGNRVLVLLDGHPLNDNWLGSSYVGYEGRTDLGSLERIEIVRGPGSVVYGTSAMSGVINLVSRPVSREPETRLGLSAEGSGVGRALVHASAPIGDRGGIWAHAAVARGAGRDFFFPTLVDAEPPSAAGHARGMDGFDAGTFEGQLRYDVFSARWFWHTHDKTVPTAPYWTLVGDPRTRQRDNRMMLELRAEPRLAHGVFSLTRAHANHYRFRGGYARSADAGGLEVDVYEGSWVGLEQRLELSPIDGLRVLVGGEVESHFQVSQLARDESGLLLDETGANGHPFWVGAGYATVDAEISRSLTLHGGARLDVYSTFGSSLNPRASIIGRPYSGGNLKLLGGTAFRAPSVYELYYNDGGITQRSSPNLGPERLYSVELEHTHEFSPLVTGSAAVFGNYFTNLVTARGAAQEDDLLHYTNSDVPLSSIGAELTLRRDLREGVLLSASYGIIQARYLADRGVRALLRFERNTNFRSVENVPGHLASMKGVVPLFGRTMRLASRLNFETGRYDRFERVDDAEPQSKTDAVFLWDVVLTGRNDPLGIDWALGLYNAFDSRYALPVSAEFRQRTVQQRGRTLLLSIELGPVPDLLVSP